MKHDSWLLFTLSNVLKQNVEVFDECGHFSASPFQFPGPYLLSLFF